MPIEKTKQSFQVTDDYLKVINKYMISCDKLVRLKHLFNLMTFHRFCINIQSKEKAEHVCFKNLCQKVTEADYSEVQRYNTNDLVDAIGSMI